MARVTRATLHMSADASEMKRGLDVARKAVSDLEGQLEKQIEAGEDYSKTLTDLGRADARAAQRQKRLDQATKKATLSTRKHTKAVKEAKQEVDGYGASLSRAVGGLKGLAAAAGVGFVVRGLFRAVQDAAELGTTLINTSRALNVTVEEFQGLDKVFRDTGGTTEQMSQAMRFFQTQAGRAARGAETAFRRYGIELGTVQENLGNIAGLLADLPANQRLTVAAEFFGEEGGTRAVAALAGGLEDFIRRFEAATSGALVSTQEAARLDDVNSAIQDFVDAWRSSVGRLVSELGPELVLAFERVTLALLDLTNSILGLPPGTARNTVANTLFGVGAGGLAGLGAGPLLAVMAEKGAAALTAQQASQFEKFTGLTPKAAERLGLVAGDNALGEVIQGRHHRTFRDRFKAFLGFERERRDIDPGARWYRMPPGTEREAARAASKRAFDTSIQMGEWDAKRAARINNRLASRLDLTTRIGDFAKDIDARKWAIRGAKGGGAFGAIAPLGIELFWKSTEQKIQDDFGRLRHRLSQGTDKTGKELQEELAGIYRDLLLPAAVRLNTTPLDYLTDETREPSWPTVRDVGPGLPPSLAALLREYVENLQPDPTPPPVSPPTPPASPRAQAPQVPPFMGFDPSRLAQMALAARDYEQALGGFDRDMSLMTDAQLSTLLSQADNLEEVNRVGEYLSGRLQGDIIDLEGALEEATNENQIALLQAAMVRQTDQAARDRLQDSLMRLMGERDQAAAERAAEGLINTYLRLGDLARQMVAKRAEFPDPRLILEPVGPSDQRTFDRVQAKRDAVIRAKNEAEQAAQEELASRAALTESAFRGLADALFQATDEAVTLGEAMQQFFLDLLREIGSTAAGDLGSRIAAALFSGGAAAAGGSSGDTAGAPPGLAMGGYHAGGLALVGERGPELVDFATPGRVYPNHQLGQALRGGNNVNVSVSFNVSGGDARGFRVQGPRMVEAIKEAVAEAATRPSNMSLSMGNR